MHVDIQEIVREETITHDWRIYLLLEGAAKANVFQSNYELTKNDFLILNPNERFSMHSVEPALVLAITFNAVHLDDILPGIRKQRFWNFPSSSADQTTDSIDECRQLLHRIMITSLFEDVDDAAIIARGLALISYLRSHYLWHEKTRSNAGTDQLVNRVIAKLESEYAEDVNLASLASDMHVSYSYLSKRFKETTQLNFNHYLNAIRLHHIEQDLKYTDKSITQVGIDNGFSQPRTMARNFQKQYGMSPQKFRQAFATTKMLPMHSGSQVTTLGRDEALSRLAGKLADDDLASLQPAKFQQKVLEVQSVKPLQRKAVTYAINVGNVLNLNQQECVAQLKMLTKEVVIAYIRVFDLDKVNISPNYSSVVTADKELITAFHTILAFGALPIIRVSTNIVAHQSPEDIVARFDAIVRAFGKSVVRKWIIEFEYDCLCSDDPNVQTVIDYFIHHAAWHRIGVHVTERNVKQGKDVTVHTLGNRFVYLSCDYLFLRHEIKADLAGLGSQLEAIRARLAPNQAYAPELALDDWNTLAGSDEVTVGTFFRAALIKEILRQNTGLDNISFWLSISSRASVIPTATDDCLSLFLYGTIRRPVYFVIRMLNSLIGECLYSSPYFSCFRNGEDYALLLSNPTYVDPRMSISDSLMQYQSQNLQLQLLGLASSRYRVVSELLDKDCGGIYNQWLKVGAMTSYSERDIKYLETITQPRLKIKLVEATDGKLTLAATQSFNSIQIYHVSPVMD